MTIKDIFDFLRNLLLSAAVMAASLFIEFQSQDGIGRDLIFSERFYEDRSEFLTSPYNVYLEKLIQAETELYFRGFKQGGIRVIERMTSSQYSELQASLQNLELLRYERYKDAGPQRWLMNILFASSFVLAILNSLWISSKIPHLSRRYFTWAARATVFFAGAVTSVFSLTTIMDTRRTELFDKDITRQEIIAFSTESLGDNEYQSFSTDHLTGISFDSFRW